MQRADIRYARSRDTMDEIDRHRLDKWLWCTRFYKSRAIAAKAISGGKVKLNGERTKPAHALRAGDQLTITLQQDAMVVDVIAFPTHRGPASMAATCYSETPQSVARRAAAREQHRLANASRPQPDHRPDKRERRELDKLRRNQG